MVRRQKRLAFLRRPLDYQQSREKEPVLQPDSSEVKHTFGNRRDVRPGTAGAGFRGKESSLSIFSF